MIKSRAKALIKPMKHQAVSLKHARTTPIVYDASDPGTGKTAVCIWDFSERRRKRGKKALVLAPRTLLKVAWGDDFKKFAPDMKVSIARATNREEAFDEDADVYVTNLDSVKWLAKKPKAFFDQFDTLFIDEITAYKHHTSQRSKAAAKIAKYFKYRRGLTGTPNGRSITDVWHQALLIDDGKRLGTSFYAFRNTVCVPRQVGRSANAINWEDRDGAEEAVFGLLSDIVVRHKFEECVDIPQHSYRTLNYQLAPGHRKTYDTMQQHSVLVFQQAVAKARVLGKPQAIGAAFNAAAVATKLLQIASGAVYSSETKYEDVTNDRYELVLDLVEERKHPLVMFYWKHQAQNLINEANKRKLRWGLLDGASSDSERERIVAAYQRGEYDVLFGHPRTVAHGMTLTKGTSTIWPGPTYDLELWKQGNKRQARIGQTEKTESIVIIAENTIEQGVYDILMKKESRMTTLLDLFGSMTNG